MGIACPVDLNTAVLRSEISTICGRVAAEPGGDSISIADLHTPRSFSAMMPENWPPFHRLYGILRGDRQPAGDKSNSPGETVLDIGSGAGMDLLLLAQRTGPDGHAIGVDMTDAMIERARESAAALGLRQVEVRKGDATALPIDDANIDVVSSNGVLNLVPEKELGFSEIVRVLKPGGRVHLADIALDVELPEEPAAILICGPVESPALCRRQSSCGTWLRSASRMSESRPVLIASVRRRKKGQPASMACMGSTCLHGNRLPLRCSRRRSPHGHCSVSGEEQGFRTGACVAMTEARQYL